MKHFITEKLTSILGSDISSNEPKCNEVCKLEHFEVHLKCLYMIENYSALCISELR